MGIQSANNSLRNFKLGLFVSGENPATSLRENLLWYYELEEAAGDRLDSSLNNLTLIETGSVGVAPGVIDLAANFPGIAANKLSKSYVPQFDFSNTDFTWSGWMYFGAVVNSFQMYLGTADNNAADQTITLSINTASNCIRPAISNGIVDVSMDLQIAGGLPLDKWTFWVIRYNTTTGLFEGRLDNEPWTTITSVPAPHHIGTETLTLGSTTNNASPFTGRLDEIGAWDRLLTDVEVDFLALPGRPDFIAALTDDEGNILIDDEGNVLTLS